MKERIILAAFLILLISPIILAETNVSNNEVPKPDIWGNEETLVISETWQTIIGGFFGLNLKNEYKEITLIESIVLVLIFVMALVVVLDLWNIFGFFNLKSGWNILVAFVITTLISITGVFANLQGLFMSGVSYTVAGLDWNWLTFLVEHQFWGIVLTIPIVLIIFLLHEILSWSSPWIKKFSQISRAEAKGRRLGDVIEKVESEEE